MLDVLSVLALLFAAPQVQQPCDSACEAAIQAAIHWVAEFRDLAFSDMVLELPTLRNTPDEAAYAGVLERNTQRLGIRSARGSTVNCQSPEGLDISKLPREWWENRCRITGGGRLLLRINSYPKILGDSAEVRVLHDLFEPSGPGYVHVLFLRRTPDGWSVTRSVVKAHGSPVTIGSLEGMN